MSERMLVVTVHPEEKLAIVRVDDRFSKESAVAFTGNLIDLDVTRTNWGSEVGIAPERFLRKVPVNGIGMMLNRYGWTPFDFIVDDGQVYCPSAQTPTLSCLVQKRSGHWTVAYGRVSNRKVEFIDLNSAEVSVAWSMPLLVKGGRIVDRPTLCQAVADDPMVLYDFSYGKLPAAEYWRYLRKVLPLLKSDHLSNLFRSRSLRLSGKTSLSEEEIERFAGIIKEAGISGLSVTLNADGETCFSLSLAPLACLPLLGCGVRRNGELVIVAVDGHQRGKPGISLIEFADALARQHIEFGFLGVRGGDVAVIEKMGEQFRLLNNPSNRDERQQPCTRRGTNLAIFPY